MRGLYASGKKGYRLRLSPPHPRPLSPGVPGERGASVSTNREVVISLLQNGHFCRQFCRPAISPILSSIGQNDTTSLTSSEPFSRPSLPLGNCSKGAGIGISSHVIISSIANRLYADRIAGGDCHHCHSHQLAGSRGAKSARAPPPVPSAPTTSNSGGWPCMPTTT